MMRFIIVFITVLFSWTQVHASGFAVKDQGTEAMGLANAYTAIAEDASAAWYNPAALAFQEGISTTVGGQYVIPNLEYTDTAGTVYSADKKNHFIPFVYMSYNQDDLPVSVGLAINAPFGLSTDWTNSGAPFTNPLGATDSLTFSDLELVNFNPSVAYKLNDQFSVAFGVSYYLVRNVALDNALVTQQGNGDGWGGNVALFYKGDDYNVGLTYRSEAKLEMSGTASALPAIGALNPAFVGTSSTVNVGITLPEMVSASISFHMLKDWVISAQYDWVNWTSFDQLDFTYGTSVLNLATGTSSSVAQNWTATHSVSAGAEWAYSDDFQARFGLGYEQTPVTDADFSPRMPDNNRNFFTVGCGYSVGKNTEIDVAYARIVVHDRNQTASPATSARNGSYTGDVDVVSVSMTYQF